MSGVKLTTSVKNAKLVRRGLQDLRLKIPLVGRQTMWDWLVEIRRKLKIYPAKRTGQKYKRTYRLGRGWNIRKASENSYYLQNTTPYTKWVQGNAYGQMQAWMHVDRWSLMRDIVDQDIDLLPKRLAERITTVARRELQSA